MNTSIKPIETEYAGIMFRSRLEARWAVFFDTLGIEWEYEPEAFHLPSGSYLPDFFLPSVNAWFEVKGRHAKDNHHKLFELVARTGIDGYIATGSMPTDLGVSGPVTRFMPHIWSMDDFDHYAWCVCPWCGKPGIEFEARGARVCGWEKHHTNEEDAKRAAYGSDPKDWGRVDDRMHSGDDRRVIAAYTAARAYRFWNPR